MTGTPATETYETGLASLALAGGPNEDRACALVRTASFADQLGKFESARALLSDAESMFEALGDSRGLADAIAWRSDVEYRSGSFGQAAEQAERLAAIGAELGDADIASWAELLLSGALFGRAVADGDRDAAERSHQLIVLRWNTGRSTTLRYTEPICSWVSLQACSPSRSTRNRSRPPNAHSPRSRSPVER
jgi:hypothetical protein